MRIGILGGGQLAQMLAQTGTRTLDMTFQFLSPDPEACAAPYGEKHICTDYTDQTAMKSLSDWADVITCEIEGIPTPVITDLEQKTALFPPARAQVIASDRLLEKQTFNELNIPTVAFADVTSDSSLKSALSKTGLPAILKTRTQGYDGRGQCVIRKPEELEPAWQSLGGVPCILEAMTTFERELSIIGVKGRNGEVICYPITENQHQEGILRLSLSRHHDPFQHQAESLIKPLLENLDYTGVLTLELFQVGDTLVANEMAPRVHNSGHWTIEGTPASQFENHLRAIAGMPLVKITDFTPSAMVNIIGTVPLQNSILAIPHTHMHLYGKATKPRRKLGHITLLEHHGDTQAFEHNTATLLKVVNSRP